MTRLAILTLTGAVALAACGEKANNPAPTATETVATTGTVIREGAPPPDQPAVTPMPAATVIQSQPGPGGSQVDLLSVKVTGDILTVTLRCSSTEKYNSESFKVPDISVIDDATAQRIAVLKDNSAKWLASRASGDYLSADCSVTPGIIWAKFPAPPATSKTVSINLPAVAPFDGVPVAR